MYFRSFKLGGVVQDQLLFHFSGYDAQLSSKGHAFVKHGLSDLKTRKTMAIVEMLDHARLLSPVEVGKGVK